MTARKMEPGRVMTGEGGDERQGRGAGVEAGGRGAEEGSEGKGEAWNHNPTRTALWNHDASANFLFSFWQVTPHYLPMLHHSLQCLYLKPYHVITNTARHHHQS